MTIIYALVDPVSNECRYVGKSINIEDRFKNHCQARTKTYVNNWIKSIRPFTPNLIELEQVHEECSQAEQFWISYMKYIGCRLTNLTKGGEGIPGLKRTFSKEHCERISKARLGKILSEEHKSKIRAGNLGKTVKEEVKKYLSELFKDKPLSEEHKLKLSIAHKGQQSGMKNKTHSDESRLKMSNSHKGKPALNKGVIYSDEIRKRMSESAKGKVMSEATKIKMSEAQKLRRERELNGNTQVTQQLATETIPSTAVELSS